MQTLSQTLKAFFEFKFIKSSLILFTIFLLSLWSTSCSSRYLNNTSANQNSYDTICKLAQVNKIDFETKTEQLQFKYKEHPKLLKQAIIYIRQSKSSVLYSGLAIILNDSFQVTTCYKISNENDLKSIPISRLTKIKEIDLKSALTETSYYSSQYYISDGVLELIAFIQNGQTQKGIFYNGCSPENINSENKVNNKEFLKLLPILRKIYQK